MDPGDVSFGFGRRVCPGHLIAETSIFLMIAPTLAVFNVKRPIGEGGKQIEPTADLHRVF
jgi:cytochrome P450